MEGLTLRTRTLLCGRALGCNSLLVPQTSFFLSLRSPHPLSLELQLLGLAHLGLFSSAHRLSLLQSPRLSRLLCRQSTTLLHSRGLPISLLLQSPLIRLALRSFPRPLLFRKPLLLGCSLRFGGSAQLGLARQLALRGERQSRGV
jgi:hypothetical protein